jgi:di/tricarboxylate transporter
LAELLASPSFDAYLTLAVTAAMFALFVTEIYPAEVVAMAGAAVLVMTGVVSDADVLKVLANPAPWTIAAMCVLSGGLVRTGALTHVSGLITAFGARRPWATLGAFGVLIVVASAFVNNTPIVVVAIPIGLHLARTLGVAPSKVMIPISYLAIVGGLCTLIGTSTNLLVDGVARQAGLAPFTLFEITPLGACLAVVALVYLRVAIPFLLPDRASMGDMLEARRRMRYFTEVVVPEGSPLVGTAPLAAAIFRREGIEVIDVLRGEESLRREPGRGAARRGRPRGAALGAAGVARPQGRRRGADGRQGGHPADRRGRGPGRARVPPGRPLARLAAAAPALRRLPAGGPPAGRRARAGARRRGGARGRHPGARRRGG